ncbi:hypothetical protein ACPZ19_51160 [Amycolatopsis lurida]
MGKHTTAREAAAAERPATGDQQMPPEPIVNMLLRERSRRTTVTSVLDRLLQVGGQFTERRPDGSGWSATIPTTQPHPGAPTR